MDLDRCGGGDGELETRDEEDDAVVMTANWRPEMRKMTMCPEDSFVIFLFFGGQFVKGGCTVLMFIFNISSLSQKKRSVALYKPPNYPVIINLIISHE